MIRQLAVLAVSVICLSASTSTNAAVVEKALETLQNFLLQINEGKKIGDEYAGYGNNSECQTSGGNSTESWSELKERYAKGMLPQGHLFSLFHPEHIEDTIKIFRALYYQQNPESFLCVAFWAYKHVNEYEFFYALDVASVHHPDIQSLPRGRPCRRFPEFCYNSDVMKKIYDIKMGLSTASKVDNNTFIVMADYSGSYISETTDNETKLAYFTEDIAFNEMNYNHKLMFPFWMSSRDYTQLQTELYERGDVFFISYKLQFNRYFMERLSVDLDDIEVLDWTKPTVVGYYPSMNYPNGMQFPRREEWTGVALSMAEYIHELEDYESNVLAAITSGFAVTANGTLESILTQEGLDQVGNMIEGNADSINMNYYGSLDRFFRYILGSSPQPRNWYQLLPSALENDLTSPRDPGYYRLAKNINQYFIDYLEGLGPYPDEDVAFDGVTIDSVSIANNSIYTYFEWFDTLIDTFSFPGDENVMAIKTRQYRLNHKPFTYHMTIKSDKERKAVIRIFMGPKYEIYGKNFSDTSDEFYEVYYALEDLGIGDNIFDLKSTDNSFVTARDDTLQSLLTPGQEVAVNKTPYGLPNHLLIPRGKVEGMDVELFVCVTEFVGLNDTQKLDSYWPQRDNKPFGFPMNRPIRKFLPNMYVFDTKIVHSNDTYSNQTLEPVNTKVDSKEYPGLLFNIGDSIAKLIWKITV